jgi:hypothetical protein
MVQAAIPGVDSDWDPWSGQWPIPAMSWCEVEGAAAAAFMPSGISRTATSASKLQISLMGRTIDGWAAPINGTLP